MAKSIHVKANKPWKRIKIPKGGFDSNPFDGLVDLQELTDYELIKTDTPKNKKRKATENVSTEFSDSKKLKIEKLVSEKDTLKKDKKGKSRKKKSQLQTTDSSVCGNRSEDQKTEQSGNADTDVKTNVSRKRKSTKICVEYSEQVSNDSPPCNEDTDSEVEESVLEKTNAINSRENKRKRKKKKKANKNPVTPVQSESATEAKHVIQKSNLDMSKWSNLFVPEALLKSLQEQGFQNPTTIQTLTLPSAIRDLQDVLAAAETGSGKTLAFGIPVLGKVLASQKQHGVGNQTSFGSSDEGVCVDEVGSENDEGDGIDVDMEADEESSDINETTESAGIGSDVDSDDGDFDFNTALGKSAHQHPGGEFHVEENEDSDDVEKETIHTKSPPQVLILEPTRELAVQVQKHLSRLAKYTDINFATVVGGMSVEKQRRLLKRLPEVIIATPGRLWQLIEEGDEHLSQVDLIHSLVVDEADRMVEKGHYEELTRLLEMINTSPRRNKKRQSFVMSATLTMEVNVPKRLLNKKKEKDLEKDKLKNLTKKICLGTKPKVFDLTPKDKTAQSLTEMRINCSMDEKDFYLYYFLTQHPGRTLVFANSKDCLRRLVSVFNLLECSPYPLHADMQQRQRLKNLDRFSANNKGLLLASDVAARGLDIPNVDYVIHYQVPLTKENYVHRSGRTARASNVGLSVMLVAPEEARNYRKIIQGVKNGEDLPLMPLDSDLLPAVKTRVNLARSIDVAEYRSKKIRLHNDFFTKAAEEMDMIVDDQDLVPTDDKVIQAEDKNRLKGMKHELSAMVKGSLAPVRMTKYPTKSGKLLNMRSIDLLKTT